MNEQRYRWILYLIVTVIAGTIAIQVYWNYKNYLVNKQQLVNDVQISLDKAVDDYYSGLAKKTTLGFSLQGEQQKSFFDEDGELSKILENIDENTGQLNKLDSLKVNSIEGITVFRGLSADSMMDAYNNKHKPISPDSLKNKIKDLKLKGIVKSPSDFELLTSKIVISISNDTLNLKKVDSLVYLELNRKNINVDYTLDYTPTKSSVNVSDEKKAHTLIIDHDALQTFSNSTFLPKNSELKIRFTNETFVVLKRIFGGIIISTLLVLAVISSLFYLLKVIKHQKQLAEVKNDLISNITHEFKTPIATIGVALESISNFNALDDKTKTKKYLEMSSNQLSKLNLMVEKLLETATLDSESLDLNKEIVDVPLLLDTMVNRYKMQFPTKNFETSFKGDSMQINVDLFHFENALNNILDNAVKYGGDSIWVDAIPNQGNVEILISDNGKGLSKSNKDRIFEKFYRVPKGNTHNVKGFGIGLYYTKTIIDKHGGTITLNLSDALTTFKIQLPHG